jgi:hypothetical protein
MISAELVLQDYVPGNPLGDDNFYSFSYFGSNLINEFSIDTATWNTAVLKGLTGALLPGGGPADLFVGAVIEGSAVYTCTELGERFLESRAPGLCNTTTNSLGFFSYGTGDWRIGLFPRPLDEGDAGTWSPAAAPAPGTLSLFALGLAGIGYKRHRDNRSI